MMGDRKIFSFPVQVIVEDYDREPTLAKMRAWLRENLTLDTAATALKNDDDDESSVSVGAIFSSVVEVPPETYVNPKRLRIIIEGESLR